MPNLNVGLGTAAVLHIGDISVELDQVRHTSPSLVISMADKKYYGALFTGQPPSKTLRLTQDGTDYWLGNWCRPGTYLPTDSITCQDCGLGHYCLGQTHRAPCTGGIIGCPTTRASADGDAGSLANRLLTTTEVDAHVPPTDISQWRQVGCYNAQVPGDYYSKIHADFSLVNQVPSPSYAIGPGTYMFVHNAGAVCSSTTGAYSSFIMVFDHAVSYRPIHASDVFYNFIDLDGPEFTGWDMFVSPHNYCEEHAEANVTGMDRTHGFQMCVYELK